MRGSDGTSKGNLTTIRISKSSPGRSTPSQKLFVPKRIIENFKENLELFDKKMKNHPALDPNIALTPEGREEREKLIRNLWSEGDYPREKVLELMELSETSELVHFLNSEEVSLL